MGAVNVRRRHWLIVAGFLAFLTTLHVTSASNDCRKGCPQSDNGWLKYQPGNVYEYNFDSVLKLQVHDESRGGGAEGGSSDATNLKLTGAAKLFAEGNCGYTLQLGGVKVSAARDDIEKKLTQNIQKPVHFTLANGQLEPHLCVDPNDSEYALNVKRAIISLLQVNAATQVETDVFGQCSTYTTKTQVGGATVISKVRNLNACAYREQIQSGIVHGIVNANAGIHSTLLIQGDYSKEVTLENGIVVGVHLVEHYKYGGGSLGGASGAHKHSNDLGAHVVTNLKIKQAAGSAAAAPATGSSIASIIFQKPDTYATKNLAALRNQLNVIVQEMIDYVKVSSAKHFIELIRLMRQADSDTLLELGAVPHPNKVLARQVYLDALFRTATKESARAVLKQIGKLNEEEKALALLSLNLVQTIDKDIMQQAANLLSPNAPKELYLVVGGIISKYCQQHDYAVDAKALEAVTKKFVDNLKHCRAGTQKEEDRIVYVLKGVANAGNGHLDGKLLVPALLECSAAPLPARVRVAALQAFSAHSCDANVQRSVLDLLRNRNEDSELRIEAYLAAVECPTAELGNQLAELVNAETVNQVGGFIASHLKVLRDSTDTSREQQRYYLGNVRVTKTFREDLRRYSHNSELSYKLAAFGLSASVDKRVIYGQQGFLPRSARLNVTAELFGTEFNVLQANVRQQNLEHLLEYYLGPKGLLHQDFQDIMKNIRVGARARRSIADEAAKVAKKYKTAKNSHDINFDLSLKLFGTEMFFLSLGDRIPTNVADLIAQFSQVFDEAKHDLSAFQKQFQLHSLFLDTKLQYPTGAGVPLEFAAQGFAANKIDLLLNLDMNAIIEQNWQQAQHRVKLVPSFDVNIQVQLGFNAYVLETGVRLDTMLHSAGGGDVTVSTINDGNGINLAIELPRDKLELVNVRMTREFYVGEQDKPQRSVPLSAANGKKPHGVSVVPICFNQLETLGFNFCIETLDVERPKVDGALLAENYELAVYLTSERKLNVKALHVPTATGGHEWKLEFSTPGSQVSHDTVVTLAVAAMPQPQLRLTYTNPETTLAFEVGIHNDNTEMVVYAQREHNGQRQRNRIGFHKNGNEYRPVIEMHEANGGAIRNDIGGYRADGRIIVQEQGANKRYQFESFQITNANNERLLVNGHVETGDNSFDSDLRVSTGPHSYAVKAHLQMANDLSVGVFVNDEATPQYVYGYSLAIKLSETDYNLDVVGKLKDYELQSKHTLRIEQNGERETIGTQWTNAVSVKRQQQQTFSGSLNGAVSDHLVRVSGDLQHGKRQASMAFKLETGSASSGADDNKSGKQVYTVEFNGKYNKHFVDFHAKAQRNANGQRLVVDNVLSSSWGTSAVVRGELSQRLTLSEIYIDLSGSGQLVGKAKPAQFTLKVVGGSEKTQTDFRLTTDGAELLRYTGETTHPQDKISAVKFELYVKENALQVKCDGKLGKNGKGELSVSAETTQPPHKLDVTSKFHAQSPKYDVETSIIFDGDQKFHYKTENVLDKQKFVTKNVLDIAGKQVKFDANGAVKGEWIWNGEINGNFALHTHYGSTIDGNFRRKMQLNAKTGLAHGTLDAQLNEAHENGKKRSLVANLKLEQFNWQQRSIVDDVHVDYTNFQGENLVVRVNLKNVPMGNVAGGEQHGAATVPKQFELSANVEGTILRRTPLSLHLTANGYNTPQAQYTSEVKYADAITATANGNYKLAQRGQPATFELVAHLDAPKTDFKTFDLRSSGKLLRAPAHGANKLGVYELELKVDERAGDNQYVHFSAGAQGGEEVGTYQLEAQTASMPAPFKMNGEYQSNELPAASGDDANDSGSIRLRAGKHTYKVDMSLGEQFVKVDGVLSYTPVDGVSLVYTLKSNSVREIHAELNARRIGAETYSLTVNAKHDGNRAYGLQAQVHRAAYRNGIEVELTLPDALPVKVVWIVELAGERKAKLAVEVANLLDIDFTANAEASYTDIDNFYYLAQWNSEKLKLPAYDLSVRAQSKSLQFHLKNANGVIVAGTATYALKKEHNKATIEGQGQLQYAGKVQNTNFKLIRQTYELATDHEVGVSYTLNGNFGARNGVSTLKLTNKDFNVKLSVCEERKQCTNLQLQSSISQQSDDVTHYSLLWLIDLRELGYPYEFELQSKTIRQGFQTQYNLDSTIVSNSNHKYQLNVQWRQEGGHVLLKLPKRELMLEAKHKQPAPGSLFGHYSHSMKFWFDKNNKPQDVTSLVVSADLSGVERVALNAQGSVKFEHPRQRPLSVNGHLDVNREKSTINAELTFDIFRTPEQQIQANVRWQNVVGADGRGFNISAQHTVRSTGLNLLHELNGHIALDATHLQFTSGAEAHCSATDMRASYFVLASKDRIVVLVHGLNQPLIDVLGEFDRQHYSTKWTAKFQLFDQTPLEIGSELQPSQAKFTLKRGSNVDIGGEIKLGKELKVHVNGKNGQQLLQGRIALDAANFLQTAYTSNNDDLEAYLSATLNDIQGEVTAAQQQIHQNLQRVNEVLDKQRQLVLDSVPDLTEVKNNYVQHVNNIVKELEQDEALQKLAHSYGELTTKLTHIVAELSAVGAEQYENAHKAIAALHTKLQDIVKNIVLPAWEEFLHTATGIVGELRANLMVLYTNTVKLLMSSMEKYGPTLKVYGKALNEAVQPFLEAGQELYKLTAQFIDELINDVKSHVANIPTFEHLRNEFHEQLEKLRLVDRALVFVNDVFAQLHIFPQSAQTNEFLQKAQSYLEKKIKQEPVNDEEAVEELVKLLLNALRSIWAGLANGGGQASAGDAASTAGVNSITRLLTTVPNLIDVFQKFGQLLTFRLSVFNYILNENWAHLFNGKHWLHSHLYGHDFSLHGHIADGHHIFTFDGQYYNYPANCKFILAQDSVDNNFTVVGNLNNGKLKSIVLADRNGNFVEVNDVGVLKLNGQAAEYPQHVGDMHVWRRYYVVYVKSEYGADIICTSDLKICHVIVDGFYTSKVRGLFGNGNAEPYDDYVKTDGTLAGDPSELVVSYGLGKCNPVPAQPSTHVQHTELCNELFGYDSTLITGYLFVSPQAYRDACDVSVTEASDKDREAVACNIAAAYASAVRVHGHFASLPRRCLKCNNGPPTAQRDYGSEFNAKVPTNKADLVFVVDLELTANVMQQLIAPAIIEIRETLKVRGLTDVQIAVIAYNKTERYPALLTSDNGKLNYHGNLAEVKLHGPERFCESCFNNVGELLGERALSVQSVVKTLLQHIVPQSDELAYKLAINYPFRAGAAKSIIGVLGEPYEPARLLRLMGTGLCSDIDLATVNLVTPVQELSLEGTSVERIIGFNSRVVGLLDGKDARKRSKLQYKSNLAIEYVLGNGGWVFATQNFDKLPAPDQKKALSQLTNVIADTLFKTEIVSECKCASAFAGLHAQYTCAVKSTNFVPNKKVKTAS